MIGRLRSLLRRAPVAPQVPEVQPATPGATLLAVRIFTAVGPLEAELDGNGGERITELLNAFPGIRVRAGASLGMPETRWTPYDLNEVLIVIPPEQATDPMRRLRRPGQRITIKLGPYVVAGAAHVPPGAEATAFLLRHRQHFVPITGATITHADGSPGFAQPVVIVNVWRAESLRGAAATT